MEMPYGMHILHSNIEHCRTLRYKIPSPFAPNTVITLSCELYYRPDGQLDMEVWGELPNSLEQYLPKALPAVRAKMATAVVPFPPISSMNAQQFSNTLTQTICNHPLIQKCIQDLMVMYAQTGQENQQEA